MKNNHIHFWHIDSKCVGKCKCGAEQQMLDWNALDKIIENKSRPKSSKKKGIAEMIKTKRAKGSHKTGYGAKSHYGGVRIGRMK